MIPRYTLPPLDNIWSEQNRMEKWLEIEVLAVEARAEIGEISAEDYQYIKKKAHFDLKRVKEIEEITHHDVVAFVSGVAEIVGEESRHIHYGMTSSDILDTGLAIQMREALDAILGEAKALGETLKQRGLELRDAIMVGRTHGVHAEPMFMGQKFAIWAFEMWRNIDRLNHARDIINCGMLSGAVGNYAHLNPYVERYVCDKLGLRTDDVSSQVIQRDRHAECMAAIAITGATLEKIATEIRGLQRTDVLEAEEPFYEGQKGSSAMPHKRNPIICERVAGMARLLRGNLTAALENISLWHERDISHSSVERVILPDSTIAIHYMLIKMNQVIKGMLVYKDNMLENLMKTNGLVFSESLLLSLIDTGMSRDDAYGIVQSVAMKCWKTKEDLKQIALADDSIKNRLSEDQVKKCFDIKHQMRFSDRIFSRLENLFF